MYTCVNPVSDQTTECRPPKIIIVSRARRLPSRTPRTSGPQDCTQIYMRAEAISALQLGIKWKERTEIISTCPCRPNIPYFRKSVGWGRFAPPYHVEVLGCDAGIDTMHSECRSVTEAINRSCRLWRKMGNIAFMPKGKILRQGCRCVHNDSILRH